MIGVQAFGRLEDVEPRSAWAHEAHAFTPWLAENLDRLSEAIGIPLELTGREVGVGRYSADILASSPGDGAVVLIENQLEASDHTHLGQILTYLAGLEAQVVIWLAPQFREEHLSALRWLNQHTDDRFSFFAVRLRVVKIGNSPPAPLFDILEKPNTWDRRVQQKAREVAEPSAVTTRACALGSLHPARLGDGDRPGGRSRGALARGPRSASRGFPLPQRRREDRPFPSWSARTRLWRGSQSTRSVRVGAGNGLGRPVRLRSLPLREKRSCDHGRSGDLGRGDPLIDR